MTAPGPDADLEPFVTPPGTVDPDVVFAHLRAPEEAGWPFRHVALSCDHPAGCDDEVDADIRADTFDQALPFLLDYARREGWSATDDGRVGFCPVHRTDTDGQGPSLLGVPGGEPA